MTVTLQESAVYIGVTVLLIIIQIYQQHLIRNLQKEIRRLWEQAATTAIVTYAKVEELEKKLKDK